MVQVPELACAEALQKAVTLAIEGDVDKAAELLRSEGHEASITALTSARESVLDAALRQDKVEAAANVALEVLRSKQPLQLQSQEILLRALVSAHRRAKLWSFCGQFVISVLRCQVTRFAIKYLMQLCAPDPMARHGMCLKPC